MEEVKGCLTEVIDDVKEFHKAFNHPCPNELTKLSLERKLVRAKWMREEINEFLETNDIAMEADAMADLLYFLCGTICEMGLTGEQFSNIFKMVQNANMAKLWEDNLPHYDNDGKVIKPEGWVAPDEKIKAYIDDIIKSNAAQLTILNE